MISSTSRRKRKAGDDSCGLKDIPEDVSSPCDDATDASPFPIHESLELYPKVFITITAHSAIVKNRHVSPSVMIPVKVPNGMHIFKKNFSMPGFVSNAKSLAHYDPNVLLESLATGRFDTCHPNVESFKKGFEHDGRHDIGNFEDAGFPRVASKVTRSGKSETIPQSTIIEKLKEVSDVACVPQYSTAYFKKHYSPIGGMYDSGQGFARPLEYTFPVYLHIKLTADDTVNYEGPHKMCLIYLALPML